MKTLGKLWKDDQGALISIEYLFVATILVIGIVVGLANLRDSVNAKLTELGNAIGALSDAYTVSGSSGTSASVTGSATTDAPENTGTITHTAPTAVSIDVTP